MDKKQNDTDGDIRIEELEGRDCLALRTLWEEVFFEDSMEFTEYYFKEKAVHNHAFAVRDENGFRSMVHLSPCEMEMRVGNGFTRVMTSYIVGVATAKEYRHRGHMDSLLRRSLSFLYSGEQPFAFLMPADPEIYRPYQFHYIYDREEYGLAAASREPEEIYAAEAKKERNPFFALKEKEIPELVSYVNCKLRESKDVFIKRDADYYRTILKELHAQNGDLYLIRGKDGSAGRITGYFLYTREDGQEIQEAVWNRNVKSPVQLKGERNPIIMARIVHLKKLLSLLRTMDGEITVSMDVTDPLLPDNNGVWFCRISENTAKISGDTARVSCQSRKAECFVSVEKLAAWFFGYLEAEECFSFPTDGGNRGMDDKNMTLCKLNRLYTFRRVFINEII